MPPHFNDSRREYELREICGHCGKRNGIHNMLEQCPVLAPNGLPVLGSFSKDKQFQKTGQYESNS